MSSKMQLRPKLYVHKDLRCNGKRYPKGSVLPWRDEGLETKRVLLLLKTQFLGKEQWPGHPGGKPAEPEQLDIETGIELEARLKQEQEERQAREDHLEERKRELMGEGRSEIDAASQAVGELAGMSARVQLLEDEEVERAERKRQQLEDRKRLEAEEAQRKSDEQAKLAGEKAEREAEKKANLEAEEKAKGGDESEGEKSEQEKQPESKGEER